jgi:hypothetical protein
MTAFLFWTGIGFVCGLVVGSFFEWTLHRFFMHRETLGWRYPFDRHALVHHQIFRADHTYHASRMADAEKIPMAWWNGPVIVAICILPFVIVAVWSGKWGLVCGGALACTLYFTAYEYMHWCMHLPKRSHVERSGIYFRLNGHCLLHHRYMHRNYNVVLPLAGLLLGTLLLRSKVQFQQACGPAVPDVQPKGRRHQQRENGTRVAV